MKGKNRIIKYVLVLTVYAIVMSIVIYLVLRLCGVIGTENLENSDEVTEDVAKRGPWEKSLRNEKKYLPEDFGLYIFVDGGTSGYEEFSVTGWAFVPGTIADNRNYEAYLKNLKTGKTFLLRTVKDERPDVAEWFENNDVINCGFKAYLPQDRIDFGKYELYLKMEIGGEKVLIDTEHVIDYIGPIEYQNRELNRIFKEHLEEISQEQDGDGTDEQGE